MAAFELQDQDTLAAPEQPLVTEYDRRRVKDECIVAYKVYDSCRRQNCLTARELGPARASEEAEMAEAALRDDDIVTPPPGAASVTMDKARIKKIHVAEKQPCPFRNGFWDVDIKFVFEYRLTFRATGGGVISRTDALNVFNMKATLFGSIGGDLVVSTDLFRVSDGSTFEAAPFIWVEANGVTMKCLRVPF